MEELGCGFTHWPSLDTSPWMAPGAFRGVRTCGLNQKHQGQLGSYLLVFPFTSYLMTDHNKQSPDSTFGTLGTSACIPGAGLGDV